MKHRAERYSVRWYLHDHRNRYGTPYLLSLGLTKELTSLVWLAGPVSGFIVQPIIGALSDNSSSKYRRRRWVVYATVLIVIATLILAFASELATWIVNLLNIGEGDWDPTRIRHVRNGSIRQYHP